MWNHAYLLVVIFINCSCYLPLVFTSLQGPEKQYEGIFHCVHSIMSEEGTSTLFKVCASMHTSLYLIHNTWKFLIFLFLTNEFKFAKFTSVVPFDNRQALLELDRTNDCFWVWHFSTFFWFHLAYFVKRLPDDEVFLMIYGTNGSFSSLLSG